MKRKLLELHRTPLSSFRICTYFT